MVAQWLKPPFSTDGWRLDVANMTGRLGPVDLNAEVRQLIRASVKRINPDAILLGESTNDAASDLQGDGWDGAMTYPSFTRPLWGWLSEPTGVPYLDADGVEQTEAWFFGQPTRRHPALHRARVRRSRRALHRRHPVAGAPGQHAAAEHARHRAVRDQCRTGDDPGGGRPVDDHAGPARRVRRRRVRPDRCGRRAQPHPDPVGRRGSSRRSPIGSPCTAISSASAARTPCSQPAECGGCTSTT